MSEPMAPATASPESFASGTAQALQERLTVRELFEAGVHFGHQTRRWNPRMKPFLFGERNGVHIVDLDQTLPRLEQALEFVRRTVASGGKVLFVGTKRQAQAPIQLEAERAASLCTGTAACRLVPTNSTLPPFAVVWRTKSSAVSKRASVWSRSTMWMPLRSPKMKRFIFGFQRCV